MVIGLEYSLFLRPVRSYFSGEVQNLPISEKVGVKINFERDEPEYGEKDILIKISSERSSRLL